MEKTPFSALSRGSTPVPTMLVALPAADEETASELSEPVPFELAFELEDDDAALLGHTGGADDDSDAAEPMPLWVVPLLVAAVVAASSAGATFATMREVPALSLAAWRLQLTTLLLLPGCIFNYRSLPSALQARTRGSLAAYMVSGTSLAVTFGSWVWGIEHTSLIHAYLLVSVTPIAIAAGTWLLRRPISNGELAGTALATFGAGLLTLGPAAKGSQVSLLGDLSSLCAAISLIGYLEVGRRLRAWMPIFLYACPVTGIAALLSSIGAVALEGARPQVLGAGGLFGWLSREYIVSISYMAFVPGIVGHTGLNTVLKYLAPLVVSLSIATEPLVGSCIGYFILGISDPPNVWIVLGGTIISTATVITTVSQFRRQAQQRQGLSKRAHSLTELDSPRLALDLQPERI